MFIPTNKVERLLNALLPLERLRDLAKQVGIVRRVRKIGPSPSLQGVGPRLRHRRAAEREIHVVCVTGSIQNVTVLGLRPWAPDPMLLVVRGYLAVPAA